MMLTHGKGVFGNGIEDFRYGCSSSMSWYRLRQGETWCCLSWCHVAEVKDVSHQFPSRRKGMEEASETRDKMR